MEEQRVIAGKYIIGEKIGSGSFGDVYQGLCIISNETVALKLERTRSNNSQLENEYRVCKSIEGGIGIPRVYWYGPEENCKVIAYELLGQSLDQMLKICSMKLSLKTVLMVADQCISRLEYLHSRLYIHRDIKPENFLLGLGKKNHVVYIIDFGLSKKYLDIGTNKHIKYKEGKSLTGTARYVSVFTHLGIEQSRRDDLESLGYLFLYLLNGTLPWIGIPGKTKNEKYKLIGQCKSSKPLAELCQDLPEEFSTYLNYCRSLKFEQKPDYAFLKKNFRELFIRMQFNYDYIFDWDIKRFRTPGKTLRHINTSEKKNKSAIRQFDIRREMTCFDRYIKKDNSSIKESKKEFIKENAKEFMKETKKEFMKETKKEVIKENKFDNIAKKNQQYFCQTSGNFQKKFSEQLKFFLPKVIHRP
jgi:serine/threonine protein kinase